MFLSDNRGSLVSVQKKLPRNGRQGIRLVFEACRLHRSELVWLNEKKRSTLGTGQKAQAGPRLHMMGGGGGYTYDNSSIMIEIICSISKYYTNNAVIRTIEVMMS